MRLLLACCLVPDLATVRTVALQVSHQMVQRGQSELSPLYFSSRFFKFIACDWSNFQGLGAEIIRTISIVEGKGYFVATHFNGKT